MSSGANRRYNLGREFCPCGSVAGSVFSYRSLRRFVRRLEAGAVWCILAALCPASPARSEASSIRRKADSAYLAAEAVEPTTIVWYLRTQSTSGDTTLLLI